MLLPEPLGPYAMLLHGRSGAILYLLCLHVNSLVLAGNMAGVAGIYFHGKFRFPQGRRRIRLHGGHAQALNSFVS